MATAPMMIGVLLDAVDGGGGGAACAAPAGYVAEPAAAGALAAAATGAGSGGAAEGSGTGGGSARGALTGTAGRDAVVVAFAAETDVAVAAAGGGGVSSTPQCTQNFAVGWFSLPQAAHFIDRFLPGNSRARLCCEDRRGSIRADPLRGAPYYGPIVVGLPPRGPAAQRSSRRPRLNATIAPGRIDDPRDRAHVRYAVNRDSAAGD
jgi:hypothetical protein